MQLKNALGTLCILAAFGPLGACYVEGNARVAEPAAVVEVDEEPPAPRPVAVVAVRPGFIWVEGRWVRSGGRWVWRDGFYQRERVGMMWEQGRWERRGNRHVWVEGHWRAR